MRVGLIVGFALVAGCTDNPPAQTYIAGFSPPPVQAGYTRYVTPITKAIPPGGDIEICAWVAPPAGKDRDVLDISGYQSTTGHHAVMYASTEKFPVGEAHECTSDDMISISFLGGIGGEGTGGSVTTLPPGLFFRMPSDQLLMANTHWLNATDNTVDGQAVIDIKWGDATADHTVTDMFVNNADTFNVAPGQTGTMDNSCVFQKDMNFAMATNHMHSYGSSAYSEIVHTDGTKTPIRTDPKWSPEWQFNPQYTTYSIDAPFVVHAGETIHTHCEWANTTTKSLQFPDEMCVTIGFYFPGAGMTVCENGGWGQ